MILPQRLTFQLTPLLDLLLIVIFAQYLEVRESADAAASNVRAAAEEQIAAAQRQTALQRRERAAAQQQADQIAAERARLQQQWISREQELETALKHALAQQREFGDLVAELFQVPDELIAQATAAGDSTQPTRSPQEAQRLREEFAQLASERGRQVLRHFLKYEEMRKRCDLWDVYVNADGLTRLRAGEQTFVFRASTPDAFANEIFARYKSLPDLKRMVIILFSYGNAKAIVRKAAADGLRQVTIQMQSDSGGQTRFEYANLGFQPEDEF